MLYNYIMRFDFKEINMVQLNFYLTKEELSALLEDFNKVENQFKEIQTITAEEKKSLVKTGDKSVGFITEAVNTITFNKDFLPNSFDENKFKKEYETFLNIGEFLKQFNLLHAKLEDIYALMGDSCHKTASEIYKHLKASNSTGKYNGLIENMANHIPKKTKKAPETPQITKPQA